MKPQILLSPEMIGNNFQAIKNYERTTDYKSGEHNGFKIRVNIQDEKSNAFMETITLKIKNVSPTITEADLQSNKVTPVKFVNLKIGIWNNELTFSAEDMLPAK